MISMALLLPQMQERDFIPKIGMKKKAFWNEVRDRCKQHQADNILIYMALMLEKLGLSMFKSGAKTL